MYSLKKRKGWYIKRTQIFNIFRFFGDFFLKKEEKKRNETDNETWELIEEKGRDKTSCHDVLWSTRKKEENKEGIQKTKLQKHDKGNFFCAKKITQKGKWQKMSCFFFEDKNTEERDFHSSAKVTGSEKYQKKREQKKGTKKQKTPKKEKVQKRFKKSEN